MYSVWLYRNNAMRQIKSDLTRLERRELIQALSVQRNNEGGGPTNFLIITYLGNKFHSSF